MKINKFGLIGAVAVIGFLAFFALDWFCGATKGRKMLPELSAQLSLLDVPNSDKVIEKFASYKCRHAVVGKAISTSLQWDALREFYSDEMRRLGWAHSESQNVLEWRKDLGGKLERFRKGRYVATLHYSGKSTVDNWTYSLEISIGLH